MTDTAFLSATKLTEKLRKRELSSRELLTRYLERVKRYNPDLNAIVAMNAEAAKKRADEADKALKNGDVWGPLHGLPITVKDSFEVAGLPATSGSETLRQYVPESNADVVQALIDAGAIVVGKTNMPLYGSDIQSYNAVYGQTNNPWDKQKTPGGSSGGAAAAVAAGLCGLEVGSDIGGSIRTPAHFCGIYGHKPTFGIVPAHGHIPPPPGIFTGNYIINLDILVNGPLARNARDLDLALQLLVAPGRSHRTAWRISLPPPRGKKLRDYRIGLWLDHPECPVDTAVGDILQTAVDRIAKAGATLVDRRPDIDFATSHDTFLNLLAAVMGSGAPQKTFDKWLALAPSLAPDDRSYGARHMRGAVQRHNEWIRSDAVRQLLRQKWEDYFQDVDALICPVCPVVAIDHDHRYIYERTITVKGKDRPYMDLMGWAGLAGVVYLPATVAPAGFTPEGLPAGLQIVGPHLEDRTPIDIAAHLEDCIGGFTPPPGY